MWRCRKLQGQNPLWFLELSSWEEPLELIPQKLSRSRWIGWWPFHRGSRLFILTLCGVHVSIMHLMDIVSRWSGFHMSPWVSVSIIHMHRLPINLDPDQVMPFAWCIGPSPCFQAWVCIWPLAVLWVTEKSAIGQLLMTGDLMSAKLITIHEPDAVYSRLLHVWSSSDLATASHFAKTLLKPTWSAIKLPSCDSVPQLCHWQPSRMWVP